MSKKFETTNLVYDMASDETERELESDEARAFGASKKEKTDNFRMNQNRYGAIVEAQPNSARNAKEMGMISFFSYSTQLGIHCTHSFFVANPIFFKWKGGLNKAVSEICLYRSRTNEIFFFNKKEAVTKIGIEEDY